MACSKEDGWIRRFSVTDPIKHVKGFTLYKITSMVYPKKYPESVTKVVIWKRYNDFKKLHKELRIRHKKLHLPDEFPPFVKAKFFSRFEADVVEERRKAALTLMEFVAKHSSLFTSDVFVKFFECGYTVDCEDGTVSNSVVRRSASPLHHSRIDPDTGQGTSVGSSDDDLTSFTTDTDSAVSTPLQGPEKLGEDESPPDLSVEEDTWSGRQLKSSLSQTTLSSLASVESLFSRRLQSFKNRFTRDSASEAKQKESEAAHYWTETQKIVNQAEIKEREGDYQTAFDCYKQAIAQLLSGVQNDTDSDRRKLVKERTADYLCKAEFIANHFLSNDTPSKRKTGNDLVPLSQLWQPLSDLQYFKVVGVIGKVMLVIDSRTHFLFIIKALIKSAMPVDKNKSCIFPRRIPYMIDLHSIFETDSCIYLVLQYISGGRLWDYISPFLVKSRDETPVRSRRSSNPPPSADQDHISVLSTSDSCPSALNLQVQDCEVRSTLSSPGTSYLDLIRDYTTNRQAEEQTLRVTEESSDVALYQFTQSSTEDSSDAALYQIVSDTLTNRSPDDEQTTDNLPTLTASSDNLYRDVLTLVNSEFTLNIEDSVDVDTKDLVEHAQRLLQSVDATLLESKSVISRVELAQLTPTTTTSATEQTTPVRLAVDSDMLNRDFDRLSVASNHSNRSLDLTRLAPHISSKGSSPPSSIGPEAPPQWCQLEVNGVGLAEDNVRRWAAQLLVALHALHQTGVSCLDLSFDNILVCGSSVRLTYFCSVPGVEPRLNQLACQQLFTAPELSSIFPPSPAADWWSLGSILYHLLTGQSLSSFYPSGIYCHTIVYIPDTISVEARSLLKELLRYEPTERLGSGLLGVEEIKSHPFFEDVQWDQVYDEGISPV